MCSNCNELLIENKILFPKYLEWHQHSFAAWMSQKKDLISLRLFLESIFQDTVINNCNTTLISGEAFENFLVDTHLAVEFERLAKSIGYSKIEWVVVNRKPIEYLKSIYAERSGYGVVLDLSIIVNIALEYGYVSPSSRNYNNKFIFDVKKFAKFFKKNVNKNLTIIKFEDFIKGFVGNDLFNRLLLPNNALETLNIEAEKIGIKRKRPSLEKVEFRYVANFLGMSPTKDFHDNNKSLVDSLISHRIKRNEAILKEVSVKFQNHFD